MEITRISKFVEGFNWAQSEEDHIGSEEWSRLTNHLEARLAIAIIDDFGMELAYSISDVIRVMYKIECDQDV